MDNKTQKAIVLDTLQRGEEMTVKDAFLLGIAHLPRRIKDIEEAGYNINRNHRTVTKANGKKTWVTVYSLDA